MTEITGSAKLCQGLTDEQQRERCRSAYDYCQKQQDMGASTYYVFDSDNSVISVNSFSECLANAAARFGLNKNVDKRAAVESPAPQPETQATSEAAWRPDGKRRFEGTIKLRRADVQEQDAHAMPKATLFKSGNSIYEMGMEILDFELRGTDADMRLSRVSIRTGDGIFHCNCSIPILEPEINITIRVTLDKELDFTDVKDIELLAPRK